ncbi:MAG: DUF1456 family protein [Methylobacter sp.]
MINNDVLRRVRYAMQLRDPVMIEIFALSGATVTLDQLLKLLKKNNEPDYLPLSNKLLEQFLDGLIIYKRGKQENPPVQPPKPAPLNNNLILKKLRIALEFREEDMLETFKLADFSLSRGELSSFFRQKDHKHYRECGDQILRNFLQGLVIRFRNPNEDDD